MKRRTHAWIWAETANITATPTPGTAWENMRREEKRLDAARLVVVSALVPILRQTAELAGFEIIGRIPLRDKATGKEYR